MKFTKKDLFVALFESVILCVLFSALFYGFYCDTQRMLKAESHKSVMINGANEVINETEQTVGRYELVEFGR